MVQWLEISLLILILTISIIMLIILWKKTDENRTIETDYHALFVLGICFLPMGLIFASTINIGFLGIAALGLIYLLISLINIDKWKK